MSTASDILRLRVLLCFLSTDNKKCTVTGISRTLVEEKYKITRILSSLEKEKLIDKSDSRNPRLTEAGYKKAKMFEERLNVTLNHLIYEGLDIQSAHHDAFYWALYSTENSMRIIRSTEERYRVKYELKDRENFSGTVFCKHIKNGTYQFPFVIYSDSIVGNTNVSALNGCFESSCSLVVKNGSGIVRLHTINKLRKSDFLIQSIRYNDGDLLIQAEKSANIFSIPASVIKFSNLGSGIGQVLHGILCLKIKYSLHGGNAQEDTVIFTVLI